MGNATRSARNLTVLAAGALACLAGTAPAAAAEEDTMVVQGVFRDFRAAHINKGGHPDFEANLPNGRAVYMGIAKDTLNAIGDPELLTTGHKVTVQPKDGQNRNIIGSKPYLAVLPGDSSGSMSATNDGAVESALSFSQWFNETPAAMGSQLVSLTLTKSGNMYGFDGEPRKEFEKSIGAGANKNWGYTFELVVDFAFERGRKDTIVCGADDCLWVYIDGRLVIDLGGAHNYTEQVFEVNRLTDLEDGKTYQMKIFYAERQKQDSWLKFQTSVVPMSVQAPPVAGLFD